MPPRYSFIACNKVDNNTQVMVTVVFDLNEVELLSTLIFMLTYYAMRVSLKEN